MWMVNTCTLVPHITIIVAVTEGQTVFGVYVDGHAACTVSHPPQIDSLQDIWQLLHVLRL
jgi:hypothetical protein